MNRINPIQSTKLWNLNFILLWQGQLVSEIGDIVYEIGLSFYVLSKTGSTLMMSYVLAATLLPRIILSPIAGIIADKSDKQLIIVVSDFARGIFVLIIGLLGLFGFLEIWMLFVSAVVIGIGSAFSKPTINAVLPEITTRSKLMAANAAFSLVQAVSSILGYFVGGLFYAWVGAYVLFVINGASYLISAVSGLYLNFSKSNKNSNESLPQNDIEQENFSTPKPKKLLNEIVDLFKTIWQFKGLRFLLIANAIFDYFSFIGITLILPFFQAKKEWGATYYGITMGVFTLGVVCGLLVLTKTQIPSYLRSKLYIISTVAYSLLLAPTPFISNFWILTIPVFLAGFCSATSRVIERNTLQTSISTQNRAKVFGVWSTISSSLIPLAMISAGVFAQFFNLSTLISFVFGMLALIILILSFQVEFISFLDSDSKSNI